AARNTAVGAADTATGASASASSSATLAARLGFGQAMHQSPVFSQGWTNGQIPPGWANWAGGGNAGDNKRAGIESDNGLFLTVPGTGTAEAANRGVFQPAAYGSLSTAQSDGWYVQELTVRLDAGALTGAGMHLQHYDGSGTIIGSTNINCASDQTLSGSAVGAGVVGSVYRYAVLIKASPGTKAFSAYAMAFWNGYYAVGPVAKSVTFTKCLVRPATAGEIEAGVARGAYQSVEARLTDQNSALVLATAALATRQSVTEARFGNVPNMVPNSTAAVDLSLWEAFSSPGWVRGYDPYQGTFFINQQSGDRFLVSNNIQINAGQTYTVSFNAEVGGGGGVGAQYVAFYDAAGNFMADGQAFHAFTGSWDVRRAGPSFVTPAGIGYVRVIFQKSAESAYLAVKRIMLNGGPAREWNDEASARDISARVKGSEGALATVQGRQQAWIQKRVIAGQAEAFGEMVALDDNGNVTSAVNFGAKRIGLWNPVTGGWVEVASFSDGKAQFSGDVAINGNLMIDGTINGRSALARDTVTPLAATYASGVLTLNGTATTRLAEQVIATVGGPVAVNFNGLMIMQHEPAGSFDVTVEMRREKISGDGVNDLQIVSETVAGAGNTADDFIGKWPVMIIDRPGPGVWRYVMNARVSASNMTRKDVLNRFMSAMELRSNN
ncbi:hypothetical protein, partial [Brevundimonas sp.]|uniref:hypothetical protein n=1 Tax=Brevundimonas sp. TaxID=1871086 RepID=UPI0025C386B8